MRLRITMALVASTTTLAALGATPAQADASNTLSSARTGDPDVFLTFVGCDNLFGAAQPPQSRLNLGPYTAPLGRRSLGLVPSAPGTASGPFTRFDSLATFDSTVAVASTSGSQGVSYVMSITPDNLPGTAWRGRAALSAPAGSWTTVSTAATAYDWTLVDLSTLAPLGEPETATTAAFAAAHGDGAGFAVTGFGCDGSPFNLDAVRGSGSTFDFEGTDPRHRRVGRPAGRRRRAVGVPDGTGDRPERTRHRRPPRAGVPATRRRVDLDRRARPRWSGRPRAHRRTRHGDHRVPLAPAREPVRRRGLVGAGDRDGRRGTDRHGAVREAGWERRREAGRERRREAGREAGRQAGRLVRG